MHGDKKPGALYVVATPIGNMDDFSPRGIETLRRCRLILAEDTRRSRILLSAFDIRTPMMSYHQFNEARRAASIVQSLLDEPGDVALISDAGTPGISDPGYHLVREARRRGVSVYGVSGPSAVSTALSVSGLPADRFAFHGFAPRGGKKLKDFLLQLKSMDIATHVMYESPKRILSLVKEIAALWPWAMMTVCTELTKRHEKGVFGDAAHVLSALSDDPYVTKGEYTVVVHLSGDAEDGGRPDPLKEPGVAALIVDRMIEKSMSKREAAQSLVADGLATRNDAYAARLALRALFESEGREV